MRNLAILFFCILLILPTWAQTDTKIPSNADTLAPPTTTKKKPVPQDYFQEDFPDWMYYVYRFTAVAVGSIPFSVLFATMGYDIYKSIDQSNSSGQFESKYLPLFFSGPEKPPYTDDEVQNILWSTLVLSLSVSVIDLIIVLVRQQKNRTVESLFN